MFCAPSHNVAHTSRLIGVGIQVWNLESDCELRTLKGHTKSVESVAMSADGRRALSAALDKTLKMWDCGKGTEIAKFVSGNPLRACAIAADGKLVIVGDYAGQPYLKRRWKPGEEFFRVIILALICDGAVFILSGSVSEEVGAVVSKFQKVWRARTFRRVFLSRVPWRRLHRFGNQPMGVVAMRSRRIAWIGEAALTSALFQSFPSFG
jgi:hypothetical protein